MVLPMAFSDLIDSHRSADPAVGSTATEDEPVGETLASPDRGEPATVEAEPSEPPTEKRVALPKPDTNNITVLTESLPNDPILPWHRFTSPWLEKDESPLDGSSMEEIPSDDPDSLAPEEAGEQLTLALDEALVLEEEAATHQSALESGY